MAALATASLLLVGGCADDLQVGTIGYVEGFSGVIAADEPQAVLVGRDVLSAGGLAFDAAVAMGFTLAVTLPSSAGLGGGGICLSYDAEADAVQALEFLPNASTLPGPKGSMAVPALARGLFALHARSGSLRWETLVAPAENLARFGFPASRALVQRMADFPRGPDTAASSFAAGLVEGQKIALHNLAGSLGRIRQRGPGEMHDGTMAREMVEAASMAGFGLTLQDLRNELPREDRSKVREEGYQEVHTFGAPNLGSPSVESAPGSTGYVVADSLGNGVACVLSMGRPFGTGIEMPNQGFLISPPPAVGGSGEALATLLKVNRNVHAFHLGIAAGGRGASGIVEALSAAILAAGEGTPLQSVVNNQAVAAPARVNVASCPGGIPRNPETCAAAVDPRGAGYGLRAGK
ncbi:gamma-glutamyltransferase [Rhodospirillum sp. A1_3_36]|uniref:gamma-glutamyltransferase n=1 Tax=Rhodospirillum sp. A1_3_36 TaxID=3391666 RepID=UPI0039A5FF2F